MSNVFTGAKRAHFCLASCVDNDCKYRGKSTLAGNYITDCFPKIFGMLLKAFSIFFLIKTVYFTFHSN